MTSGIDGAEAGVATRNAVDGPKDPGSVAGDRGDEVSTQAGSDGYALRGDRDGDWWLRRLGCVLSATGIKQDEKERDAD